MSTKLLDAIRAREDAKKPQPEPEPKPSKSKKVEPEPVETVETVEDDGEP